MLSVLNKCCLNRGSLNVASNVRLVSSIANFRGHLAQELDGIKSAGTYKSERVIVSRQAAYIKVQNSDKKILNFCANNYLGLSGNAEIIEAAQKALNTHGSGLSSVRFICGTQVSINIFLGKPPDFRHFLTFFKLLDDLDQ